MMSTLPLYTERDDQQLLDKSTNESAKKQAMWIWILTAIFLIIMVVTLIVVFEVFDTSDSSSSSSSSSSSKQQPQPTEVGMIGLWPTYGGNLGNQQTSPFPDEIVINSENIVRMTRDHCQWQSPGAVGTNGFPTIDDDANVYFTDMNGYITSIDLETCTLRWRVNVAEILGYDPTEISVGTHSSLTLFQDRNGNRGALFGAPSRRTYPGGNWYFSYPMDAGCWAIAVDISDGSLLWKLEVAPGGDPFNIQCNVHGYYVDGEYAYGGLAQSGNHPQGSQIIGRFFKIDINTHEVVDIWYPFNKDLTIYDEHGMSYLGAGAYNFPAIIDDYVVFGTGQIYRVPKYVEDCLSGDFNKIPLENSHSWDYCGNDRKDDRFWRCLEKDIYGDSIIILNKNTFEQMAAIPTQGQDVHYTGSCFNNPNSYQFCPSAGNQGPNADISAIAAFRNNGILYAAVQQKPSQLIVVEVPSGKLVLSKKFGPFSGTAMFNMAVDEDSMIAVVETLGARMYQLRDDFRVCDSTSSIHAIDIKTGNTRWIVANPYGSINETKCWDNGYSFSLDRAIEESCQFGEYLDNDLDNSANIIVPPIFNYEEKSNWFGEYPISASSRSTFRAPVTIIKDMVFIPGETGDIWVHDLFDGHFIHHFQCPAVPYSNNRWNRAGIKGGVSVTDRYVVVYCGSYWSSNYNNGNILMAAKLDPNDD